MYLRIKKYEKCISEVKLLIAKRPDEAVWAYNLWGTVLRKRGDYQDAIIRYQQALKHDASFSYSVKNWGMTLLLMGKTAEAIKKFSEKEKLPDMKKCGKSKKKIRREIRFYFELARVALGISGLI